jgi:hypothetical protein
MTEPALWIIARQVLTEREYEAIEYTCRYGFTITFTADLLDITEGAVRSRLDRAIRRLRQHAEHGDTARTLATIRDRIETRPRRPQSHPRISSERRTRTAA